MRIPLPFAKQLLRLLEQEHIPFGELQRSKIAKKIIDDLLEEKVLQSSPQRNTRYIYCPTVSYLKNYLRENYGIEDVENYIEFIENPNSTRTDGAIYASDTKIKKKRVFEGFFIKTYETIYGLLNNTKILLKQPQGIWYYIVDFQSFHIDPAITVVGVENVETFKYIEKYRYLFKNITPLFLLR